VPQCHGRGAMSPQQFFPFGTPEGEPYELPHPCPSCGGGQGVYREEGRHLVGWCTCGHRQRGYVSRADAGLTPRTVSTIRRGVSEGLRRRIYERDGRRCQLCVLQDPDAPVLAFKDFEVGHLIPVSQAIALGLADEQINDDLNLAGMCVPHNEDLGRTGVSESLWLRLLILRRDSA